MEKTNVNNKISNTLNNMALFKKRIPNPRMALTFQDLNTGESDPPKIMNTVNPPNILVKPIPTKPSLVSNNHVIEFTNIKSKNILTSQNLHIEKDVSSFTGLKKSQSFSSFASNKEPNQVQPVINGGQNFIRKYPSQSCISSQGNKITNYPSNSVVTLRNLSHIQATPNQSKLSSESRTIKVITRPNINKNKNSPVITLMPPTKRESLQDGNLAKSSKQTTSFSENANNYYINKIMEKPQNLGSNEKMYFSKTVIPITKPKPVQLNSSGGPKFLLLREEMRNNSTVMRSQKIGGISFQPVIKVSNLKNNDKTKIHKEDEICNEINQNRNLIYTTDQENISDYLKNNFSKNVIIVSNTKQNGFQNVERNLYITKREEQLNRFQAVEKPKINKTYTNSEYKESDWSKNGCIVNDERNNACNLNMSNKSSSSESLSYDIEVENILGDSLNYSRPSSFIRFHDNSRKTKHRNVHL